MEFPGNIEEKEDVDCNLMNHLQSVTEAVAPEVIEKLVR